MLYRDIYICTRPISITFRLEGRASIDRSIQRVVEGEGRKEGREGGELFARARIRVTRPANRIYIGSMFRLIIVLIKTRRGGEWGEERSGCSFVGSVGWQTAQVGDRILGSINVMRPFVRWDAPKIHPSFRAFNYPTPLPRLTDIKTRTRPMIFVLMATLHPLINDFNRIDISEACIIG